MKKKLIVLVIIFTFFAWHFTLANRITLYGSVDESMYQKLKQKASSQKSIIINSGGGEVLYGAYISKLIVENKMDVIVSRNCSSACSEFVLPAAENIKFLDAPIIGFHRSPIMDYEQFGERLKYDISNCFSSLKQQTDTFSQKKLNYKFWKDVEKRLQLIKFEITDFSPCPSKIRDFQNHMWLPTSTQLRELWGLQFDGSVCSDDYHRCTKRVDRRWRKGTRIVIGDEVYTSKGR